LPALDADTADDKRREEQFYDEFRKLGGAPPSNPGMPGGPVAEQEGEIEAHQLRDILNRLYAKELGVKDFSTDLCRSLVSLYDWKMNGKVDFSEYKNFYNDFHLIEKGYKKNEAYQRGFVHSYELRTILHTLADSSAAMKGLRISNATFNAVALRYSDEDGRVFFGDLLACVCKLKSVFGCFKAKDRGNTGMASFQIDEFIQLSIYS